MANQLPRLQMAECSEWAEYINTVARLPFYEYQPLEKSAAEIRLVSFLPHGDPPLSVTPEGCFSVEDCEDRKTAVNRTLTQYNHPLLQCHIEHVPLSEAPPFSALSYVWGDSSNKMAIVVDDRVLLVTENLYSVLMHIGFQDEHIWIDAICINQEDQKEKSWQVQQMWNIYKQAAHTAAWLGEGTNETDQLMMQLKVEDDLVTKYLSGAIEESQELPFSLPAFYDWYKRPYWNRVWILQEQRASKNVTFYCGRANLHRAYLFLAYELVAQKTKKLLVYNAIPASYDQYESDLIAHTFARLTSCMVLFTHPKPTIDLLWRGKGKLEATDRRDYVYALIGMAEDSEALGIAVDYTKTWQQVFAETAITLIKKQGIHVITYCNTRESSIIDPELPSWAPDWSREIQAPFHEYTDEPAAKYSLCSGDEQAAIFSNGAGTSIPNLLMEGTRVDTILEVSTRCDAPPIGVSSAAAHVSWLRELESLSLKGGNVYVSRERRLDAIWRTPVADLLQDTETRDFALRRSGRDVEKGFNLVRAGYLNRAPSERQDTEDKTRIALAYTMTLNMMSTGRRYFVSKEGYLGLAPGGTSPGYLVVVLFGLDMPFVLKPVADGQYRIIGEAYVHGIMAGEFMNRKPAAETFTIC